MFGGRPGKTESKHRRSSCRTKWTR